LLTRYNQRAILSRDIMELTKELSKKLGTKVFSTAIREAVTVKESQIKQLSLFDYAPKSPVTADYQAFIDELIKDEEAK
jgi:chromosome partitioning protein